MERTLSVDKFDGNNFRQWKFQINCALKAKGIEISTPKPESNPSAWSKTDGMAMYIITSSMDLNQITLIENCETALEIMSKLESIYEQKSELNKMIIHERFYQYKMLPSDSVAQHIAKVENLAKQLKESGESISDTAIMTKILGTLPPKYRSLRQAWMSLDPEKQNLNNLTARLLDEEANITCEEEQEMALLVANTKLKKEFNKNEPSTSNMNKEKPAKHRFECYNCGKRGHFSRECRAPRRGHKKPVLEKNNMLAFNVADESNICSGSEEDTWILDSGASAHMTYRKEFFEEYTACTQKSLTLGNKESIEVCGIGKILIKRRVNGQWELSMLHGVLHVPSLRRNLFSEGMITRKGYSIVKKDNSALIYKGDDVVMCAKMKINNLYELDIETVVPDSCNLVQKNKSDIKKWHERLGHINFKEIQKMSENNIVEGLKIEKGEENGLVCEACAYGKQSRFPFHKSSRPDLQPGDLVYSDVCGPMSHASVQGMRYFLLFKDAATSYRHVYFMKNKSDTLEYFKRYNAIIKNKYMHSVKTLHTDNGREYVNNAFKDYLHKEGIIHECTAPYTPEQNGRAEREIRSIVESARSMLYARDVSLNLWAEAINCAVYLLNRTSSSQTPDKTPSELWDGVKPILEHVRVFGSEGYVHVPDQLRTKLDKKSEKMLLVGYDNTNYRMYNINTKQIKISRNVVFDENKFPEKRENIAKIFAEESEEDEETDRSEVLLEPEPSFSESCLNDSSLNEKEENMHRCNNDDSVYEPSRIPDNSRREPILLRPRRNLNLEANLVEFVLPSSFDEAMRSSQKNEWSEAIKEELSAHDENQTWTPVKRAGQRTLTTKWVFSIKRDVDGKINRYKARLCARGFNQVPGIDYQQIFSPTTRYDSIRIIFSIAAKYNLEIQQFDVKTAFLNGDLEEEIYVEIPDGVLVDKSNVLKLNRSLYGLKQASRCWNKKFTEFLKSYGFVQSQADYCVYVRNVENIKVILIIYVDDALIISSSKKIIKDIISFLKQAFKIKELNLSYFVGIEVLKFDNCICLHQREYIEQIVKIFNMSECNPASTPADPNVVISKSLEDSTVNFPYREAIGSLLFLCSVSRPDISFAVNMLSRYINNPNQEHVVALKRVIRYLKNTKNVCIRYGESSDLIGYSDADFAGDVDTRKSTTGYIFLMNGGPVTWLSQKQKTIALSTTEAEFVAASESAKEILWLQQLLMDLGERYDCIELYVDNQSAIKLINNPVFHKRTKHIDVKYNFIREKVENGFINISYVSSKNQFADILTKPLHTQSFVFLREQIMHTL